MSKILNEKRNELVEKMTNIVNTAKTENRAVSETEANDFENYKVEIANIDKTINMEKEMDNLDNKIIVAEPTNETVEEKDIRNFASFLRNRANGVTNTGELTKSDNGVVIPKTIMNKVMDKVRDISPIYAKSSHYSAKGTIVIPVYGANAGDDVTVAYSDEFSELTSHSGKFTSIELTGFLAGVLVVISKSLINNSDIDIVNFFINKMGEKVAVWVENELINGTVNKISGVIRSYDATNMKLVLAHRLSVTADECIDLQDKVPDVFQTNCMWIMNKTTRKALRKLKDLNGEYLLNKDITTPFGYTLLGKPVYCSDNILGLGTATKEVILYGDFSGLAVKESEKADIQVLLEKYATQHAVGLCAYLEMDSKVENTQKIAVAVTGTVD